MLNVWVCSQLTRMGGEREKGLQFLMAASLCRKFPLISSSPRPHILPPLFPCFPSNSGDSGKQAVSENPADYGPLPAAPPPRVLTVGTVCSAFAHRLVRGAGSEKGGVGLAGIAPWEALGRREASFGKCSVVAAMNLWAWIELNCEVGWRLRDAQRTPGLQNHLRRL